MIPFKKWFTKLKTQKFVSIVLFLILGIIFYGSMFTNIRPEKLDLGLFSIAKKDIISPISIEDIEATEEKKQEAALDIVDQYILKTSYAENRVEIIAAIFDAVVEVNKVEKVADEVEVKESADKSEGTEAEAKNEEEEMGQEQTYEPMSLEEKVTILKEMIPPELHNELANESLETLLSASPSHIDSAKTTTITLIKQIMTQPIKVGEEDQQRQIVTEEINKVNLPEKLRAAMIEIAEYAIIPNFVYDFKATERLRQEAMDEVNPVKIRAGQILVKEGQVIDREMYRQLELAGLTEEEVHPNIYIGLGIFVFILTSIIIYYFKDINLKERIMYVLILAVSILLMKGISLFQTDLEIGYIFPAAMATMLIKMLLNERMALISSVIIAICASVIFNVEILGKFNFTIGAYLLISGLAGTILITEKHYRSKILKAGLFVSFINMFVIVALFMIRNGQLTSFEIWSYIASAFLSGFMSAVLTLGLLPVIEAWFGILSTIKLIELSSPNHPLLRKILIEAPGTYHHSVMVANLSEAACDAIGANGFLARVGAYYHDIGKTKRPHFYIENQMNIENPHNSISPQLSKTIITAHPYDGAEILREYKIPQEIIDICEQHHGTTLLKYFYYKAKEQSDLGVLESEFRYPGPKAQTKESAIVGIADSVEAAVRSMKNPTPQKVESLVRSILSDRIQDGQFDECDITLKELEIAAKSMLETLKGIFHTRIEYPEMAKSKNELTDQTKATS